MRLPALALALAALTSGAAAQSPSAKPPTTPERLTFEVASIKPNKSGDSRSRVDAQPNGRVMATNSPLYDIVRTAFELQPQEIVMAERAPAWITSERWDIEAKAAGEPQPQQMRAMLRNLLLDRFKLTGRYVFDATGLTDRFDLNLTWTPDADGAGAVAPTDGVSLFTAIQEQLGLRLDARQAPVDVFVIESAERPTED